MCPGLACLLVFLYVLEEGAPRVGGEVQDRPLGRLAVADTDAAVCEVGNLDALPVSHVVRPLPPQVGVWAGFPAHTHVPQ